MGVRVSIDETARSVSVIPTDAAGRRTPWHSGLQLTYPDAVALARQLDELIVAGELPQDVPSDQPA